jgi:hypothetical protein
MTRLLLLAASFTAILPLAAQIRPAASPVLSEVPLYPAAGSAGIRLEMGYAESQPLNPEAAARWKGQPVRRVELVFTRYPHDLSTWRTQYRQLLQARLDALYALDSSLFADPDIEWRYILQTQCSSEAEARQLFHGFVIYPGIARESMREVQEIVYQERPLEDSTAFLILQRHPEWRNMLIVMDWTGSMYRYGASVLLWHRLNLTRPAVKHFVFFNDGDALPDGSKRIGATGGIYRTETNRIEDVLLKMALVMDRGHGGDSPENDVEALLKASTRLAGYDEVILIADNRSAVRDIALAGRIEHPVRVVLCGVDESHPIHEDYLTLAYLTGGSVHTVEEDLANLKRFAEGSSVRWKNTRYELNGGRFRKAR